MQHPMRLLLVDDDDSVKVLVQRQLQRDFPNLQIMMASTQEEFARALQEGGFDLVITDYHLPWSDGIQILRAVKNQYPDCPVIMFTATGTEEIAVEAMKAGLDDYVLKTTKHLPRLTAAVQTALERSKERAYRRALEEQYRQLVYRLPVGIFQVTVGGRWLATNPALRSLLRATSADDLDRLPFWHLFAQAADREYAFRQLFETEGLNLPRVQLRRLDGTLFWAKMEAVLSRDDVGNVRWIDGVVMDITATITAEAEREQLTTLLRTLVEHLPEGIVLLNSSWQVVTSNEKAREMLLTLGYQEGAPLAILGDRPVTDFRSSKLNPWHQLKASDRTYEVALFSLPDQHWLLILRDITIERAIRQRLEMQERLAAIGELAAGLVHDFNNSLSGILGSVELLAMRSDLPPEVREFVETVMRCGERSAALIRKILDFSKRTVSEQRPIDFKAFLHECLQFLRRLLPESIQLVVDVSEGEYIVCADIVQMQQAITNLVINARDAMPNGGELQIKLRRVHFGAEHELPLPSMSLGDWVLLTISDTGVGIPPEHLPHIFEPFFTTKPHGTGLGLAQVYGIVSQHGGFIDVQSEVGKGTTFVLYLPAAAGKAETPVEPERAEVPRGNGELILMVEDDDGVRLVMQRMLERLNYTVLEAENGLEALNLYERYRDQIALVLTDLVMPEMSGDRLISELRRRNPQVKVVLMTGYLLSEDQQFLQIPNIVGWLQKPPNFSTLAKTLAHALRSPQAAM